MIAAESRGRSFYLAGAFLALVALALGAWDLWVERDGGENLLMQIVSPAVLVLFMVEMYRRSRGPRLP